MWSIQNILLPITLLSMEHASLYPWNTVMSMLQDDGSAHLLIVGHVVDSKHFVAHHTLIDGTCIPVSYPWNTVMSMLQDDGWAHLLIVGHVVDSKHFVAHHTLIDGTCIPVSMELAEQDPGLQHESA